MILMMASMVHRPHHKIGYWFAVHLGMHRVNFVCYMCSYTSSMLVWLVCAVNAMPNCWPTLIYAVIVDRTVQSMNCATMMTTVFDFGFGLSAILNVWYLTVMTVLLAYRATYNHDSVHPVHMAVVDAIVYYGLAYFCHFVSEFIAVQLQQLVILSIWMIKFVSLFISLQIFSRKSIWTLFYDNCLLWNKFSNHVILM